MEKDKYEQAVAIQANIQKIESIMAKIQRSKERQGDEEFNEMRTIAHEALYNVLQGLDRKFKEL